MKIPIRRWIPFVVLAFIVFYIALYFWGSHSEGYKFLDKAVRVSPEIQRRVGDVQSVHMSFLGGYTEKFVTSESSTSKTVKMTLDVVGSKGNVAVKVVSKETNGVWSVSDASINGEQINLNQPAEHASHL